MEAALIPSRGMGVSIQLHYYHSDELHEFERKGHAQIAKEEDQARIDCAGGTLKQDCVMQSRVANFPDDDQQYSVNSEPVSVCLHKYHRHLQGHVTVLRLQVVGFRATSLSRCSDSRAVSHNTMPLALLVR
jgi:hypothetical protein